MNNIFSDIWFTIVEEFSDIPDVSEATRIVLRLSMAVVSTLVALFILFVLRSLERRLVDEAVCTEPDHDQEQ